MLQSKYGWSDEICLAVARHLVSIGMTPAMVVAAWGRPEDVNRTVAQYGIREQWVYGENYVYFEGETPEEMKVTAIQD